MSATKDRQGKFVKHNQVTPGQKPLEFPPTTYKGDSDFKYTETIFQRLRIQKNSKKILHGNSPEKINPLIPGMQMLKSGCRLIVCFVKRLVCLDRDRLASGTDWLRLSKQKL